MRAAGLVLCAFVATACASTQSVSPIGVTMNAEAPGAPEPPPEKPREIVPDDVVERAAQPFRGRNNDSGSELAQERLYDELAHFDVVCLGEAHDSARDHYAELALVEALARRARVSGRAIGIGFEMFQTPYADVLGAYSRGHIDDTVLRKKTHYDDRWGFPYAYYRPVLAYGRAFGLPLKPLNAPRELTHAVAEKGLAGLTQRERRRLPDMDLDDSEHRAAFDRLMAHHPAAPGMNRDNFYAAQVVWDETMAQTAASWVNLRAPQRQMIVLAGSAHCAKSAIPSRIERRVAARVANVRLSASAPEDSAGYEYTLLFDAPEAAQGSGDDR